MSGARKLLQALIACLVSVAVLAHSSENTSSVAVLFEQLQSPKTTDQATRKLMKKVTADSDARQYIRVHLPDFIEKGPGEVQPWNNAVHIAGDLRIAEAVPALAKWIGAQTGTGVITLSREARLENEPAAKALAQIGDPSVPALGQILGSGTISERWNAMYALKLIGSAGAKKAIQEHVGKELDPRLRDFMERVLGKWKPPK